MLKAADAYVYDREIIQKCEGGVGQMKALFKRLNAEFGNRLLHEITTAEIQKWLIAQQKPGGWRSFQPLGDERRNTLLKTVRALFTFAAVKSRGWVAEGYNPAKDGTGSAQENRPDHRPQIGPAWSFLATPGPDDWRI